MTTVKFLGIALLVGLLPACGNIAQTTEVQSPAGVELLSDDAGDYYVIAAAARNIVGTSALGLKTYSSFFLENRKYTKCLVPSCQRGWTRAVLTVYSEDSAALEGKLRHWHGINIREDPIDAQKGKSGTIQAYGGFLPHSTSGSNCAWAHALRYDTDSWKHFDNGSLVVCDQ